ncbi:MAG: hypothetical protein IJB76_02770 [Clostridia bacterium]|nr:hypothetical protein [Clostridia bacterium]
MFGDSGSANHTEHSVIVKPTSKTRLIKFGLIFGAIAFFASIFIVLSALDFDFLLLPSSVMIIVLEIFAIWFFWKYTNVVYDYIIATGELSVDAVYGGRTRKNVFTVKISAASLIAPYEGKQAPEESSADKVYKCVSSFEAKDIAYIVFKDDEGKKCLAYFETNQKMRKLFKFYNSSCCKVSAQ